MAVMREAASLRAFRTSFEALRLCTRSSPTTECQAVLDAVAHFSRQQGLMVEGIPEFGVGMLALDDYAVKPSIP